ncbi:hypothetical protein [Flavobacterium sp. ACN6]|uniref:hypothetical protein n=1 Tax=Flavobacterium sp. ACN6 TaxID=1920426 RepID=UPI001143D01E|nr:hypothetical protein [Flavobacterium sp. ACN6]
MSKSILAVLILSLISINNISSQNQKIFITSVKKGDNSVEYNYTKSVSGNYFVEFELESASNVEDISAFRKTYNLNLKDNSGTLFKLVPIDKEKPIYCSYTYSYKKGSIKPILDNSVVYFLPFKEKKEVTIYESFKYNVKPEIWKNYTVYSKNKDTICAMRKGIVSEIRKFTVSDKGNTVFRTEIIIDHADGTNASYTGVDDNLLVVRLNDQVYPGSVLGVVDDIVDSDNYHVFKFNVYYFSSEEVESIDGKKLKIVEKSVLPIFYTADGYQNISGDKKYIVKYNDEVFSKEMTSKEKEKYTLNKKLI